MPSQLVPAVTLFGLLCFSFQLAADWRRSQDDPGKLQKLI